MKYRYMLIEIKRTKSKEFDIDIKRKLKVSGVCRIEGRDWSPEESERGHEWGATVGKSSGNHSPEGKTGRQGERDGGNDEV